MHRMRLVVPIVCLAVCGVLAAFAQDDAPSAADLNSAGVKHYNAGEWDSAIDAFTEALEIAPGNATLRRNLCNAYQAAANEAALASDFGQAMTLAEVATQVEPDNASPLIQVGAYHLRLGQTSEAIMRLEEALDLAPDSIEAHELLGDAYYRNNNLVDALTEWEWVMEVKGGNASLADKLDKARRESSVEADFGNRGSQHFDISYDPGTAGAEIAQIRSTLERAYLEIGRKFGRVFPPERVKVKLYTAEDFTKVTLLGEHVGALYDGKIRLPVRDKSGRGLDDDELKRRLFHEYTHVVVRYLVDDNVPWWLNEGLAETFSNELSGNDKDMLSRARREKRLFPLADLDGAQLGRLSNEDLRLAYTQSHATVEHLWSSFGPRGLVAMMNALAAGEDAERALVTAYRRNYALLEREVANTFGR